MTRREFGNYWLPVLAWMTLIFVISTGVGSNRNTSRILEPFLRWVWPQISPKALHDIQVGVRKTGHLTGYAVLAILAFRARRRGIWKAPWLGRAAVFSETVATLYAISDEFHQSFVPGREASAVDVLIDACGAAAGLFLVWAIGRMRRIW